MKLFRRTRAERAESAPEGEEALARGEAGDGVSPGEAVDPDAAGGAESGEGLMAEDGFEDGPAGEEGPEPDFFDLPPEDVAGYMPKGAIAAAPRQIDFRPVLKILGLAAALGAIAAFAYLVWPTSVARVPDLVGRELTEAMGVARSKGFRPMVKEWRYSEGHSDGVVLSQNPASARVVKKASVVGLTVSKGPRPEQGAKPRPSTTMPRNPSPGGPYTGKVICVDPGGQSRPMQGEWTDPGMTRRDIPEAEVRGATTGNAEYLVNLDIALKLKSLLEKDGITVVMTRESNDVDLSNSMRAEIANNSNANLYLRIRCANSEDPFEKGTRTLYPEQGRWTESIYQGSKEAALLVQGELLKACGTEDLGIVPTLDAAGFNWARVPAIQPEPGFLSSPRDDTLLAEENFRWKVAWGLRNGIIKFLTNP